MKGKEAILLGIILISTVMVAGCITGNVTGKYINEENPKEYFELDNDGTFFSQDQYGGTSGTWKQKDDKITLSTSFGAERLKMDDGILTDSQGKKWMTPKRYEKIEKEYEKMVIGTYTIETYTQGIIPESAKYENYLELRKDHTFERIYKKTWITKPSVFHKDTTEEKQWGKWELKGNNVVFSISGHSGQKVFAHLSSQGTRSYKIETEGRVVKLTQEFSSNEWTKQ